MLTGLLKTGLSIWMEQRRAQKEHELMLAKQDSDFFDKRIEAAQLKPILYKQSKQWTARKWLIFGPLVTHKKSLHKDRLSQLPKERSQAFILTLFAFVYSAATLYYMWQLQTPFDALAPKPGGEFSILGLFNFRWGANRTMEFTGGGAGLYLLSPMILWLTHHITGRGNDSRR